MPSINTPDHNTPPPSHQDFHWIHGSGKDERFAGFIELARDVACGVHTCLQLIHGSNLVREMNLDVEAEEANSPAIGVSDTGSLLHLSLAATALLQYVADDHIAQLNAL